MFVTRVTHGGSDVCVGDVAGSSLYRYSPSRERTVGQCLCSLCGMARIHSALAMASQVTGNSSELPLSGSLDDGAHARSHSGSKITG